LEEKLVLWLAQVQCWLHSFVADSGVAVGAEATVSSAADAGSSSGAGAGFPSVLATCFCEAMVV